MIYNMAMWDDIGNTILIALRTGVGHVVALIYDLIVYLYSLFNYLAMAEILNEEFIQNIYNKVGLILGLFMVFKLIFSLINSLITPDKLNDKKNGAAAIIQRSVLAIVLLGITPTIFDEAFKIQRLVVGNTAGNNVLYKLISNKPISSDTDVGHAMASDLYLSFYTDVEYPYLNKGTLDLIYNVDSDSEGSSDVFYDRFVKNDYKTISNNLRNDFESFGFHDTVQYLALQGNGSSDFIIEFNWPVSLFIGGFMVWMLAMYCVQVATRVIQLAYLQLIAPVPILSYISDPEGAFKKWIHQCTSTYLDLFLRLAVIYFVMTMINDVLSQFTTSGGVIFESTGLTSESNWFTLALVKVFIVLGLLLFAKRVPELLQELFPNLGKGPFSYGLNPKKELYEPLKQLYNDTPLGWAPKALGFLGKKAIGFADRKVHHVPRPRGPLGKKLDEWMPERAKDIAANRQAKIDEKLRESRDKHGKSIYDTCTYIDAESGERKFDPNKAFVGAGSRDYTSSYNAVKSAKREMTEAEKLVSRTDKEMNAAYAMEPGEEREQAIAWATARHDAAVKKHKACEAEYDLAKEAHDSMKKQSRYSRFAEIEDDYKYYTDRHPETADVPGEVPKEVQAEIERREAAAKEAQAKAEQTQQHFDELNGINRENASDNGAPTEAFSAIAEKYKREDELIQEEIKRREEAAAESRRKAEQAQQHFNELNGVTPSEGNGPKVTAENSLLAQLAEQARQQEMQQEFINRGRTNSNSQTTPNGQNSNNGTPGSSDNS